MVAIAGEYIRVDAAQGRVTEEVIPRAQRRERPGLEQ